MLKNIIFFISLFLSSFAFADAMQRIFSNPDYVKALEQFNNGDYQAAHRTLKTLDEQFPDNSVILNNLGVISVHLDDIEQAEKLFERAIIVNRYVAVGYQNLRRVYMHKAVQNYREALVLENKQSPLAVQFITESTQPEKIAESITPKAILQNKEIETPVVDEGSASDVKDITDSALVTFINSWADAWSKQDTDAYFSHYIPNYQPRPSINHSDWKQMRIKRITAPKSISVNISMIKVNKNKNNSEAVEIVFVQTYKASNFSSKAVKKVSAKKTDAGWKITKERVLERK